MTALPVRESALAASKTSLSLRSDSPMYAPMISDEVTECRTAPNSSGRGGTGRGVEREGLIGESEAKDYTVTE